MKIGYSIAKEIARELRHGNKLKKPPNKKRETNNRAKAKQPKPARGGE